MPAQTLVPFLSFTYLRGLLDIVGLAVVLGYTFIGKVRVAPELWKHRGVQWQALVQMVYICDRDICKDMPSHSCGVDLSSSWCDDRADLSRLCQDLARSR